MNLLDAGTQIYEAYTIHHRDFLLLEDAEVTSTVVAYNTCNWVVSGWHGVMSKHDITSVISNWPISIEDNDISFTNHGYERGGVQIVAANFTTTGTPMFLRDLARERSFKHEGLWLHLQNTRYRRGQPMASDPL